MGRVEKRRKRKDMEGVEAGGGITATLSGGEDDDDQGKLILSFVCLQHSNVEDIYDLFHR